jgi:hypothetical protein
MPEVVDSELKLIFVFGQMVPRKNNPGVVQQNIDPETSALNIFSR